MKSRLKTIIIYDKQVCNSLKEKKITSNYDYDYCVTLYFYETSRSAARNNIFLYIIFISRFKIALNAYVIWILYFLTYKRYYYYVLLLEGREFTVL